MCCVSVNNELSWFLLNVFLNAAGLRTTHRKTCEYHLVVYLILLFSSALLQIFVYVTRNGKTHSHQ